MTSESMNSSFQSQNGSSNTELPVSGHGHASDISSALSSSRISSWALNQRTLQSVPPPEDGSKIENAAISTFTRITNGIGTRLSSAAFAPGDSGDATSTIAQGGVLESLTKGLVDTSRNAVKAVQVKARHIVSQNKRRYQEGGFDLDMAYITENMIAMGFPAGDISSGLFGYFEGFYRNQMEEVINFFETHHKGRYKVYNLCSERLYDASLFEGKVASFPFEDHNCPPLHLIKSFCQSAYSWLKEDILNVVVVHCKAGMARTGLMICSLLLFLKFFPTAEEAISYYNQKRCVDGKGLILPSQIRYVKYFERILKQFSGENQTGRRCMLRGFRLHRCPHWIRPSITISNHNGILFSTKKHPKTKNLMPEDFWICAARKGIAVFAIPGDPGVTELAGDFKIHFHDRHGDFCCWLNTTMMDNRLILNAYDLDDFDKRKLPSPGFQVEIVMIDYDGIMQTRSLTPKFTPRTVARHTSRGEVSDIQEKDDDVFSDSEGEEIPSSSEGRGVAVSGSGSGSGFGAVGGKIGSLTQGTDQLMSRSKESTCTASGVSKKPNSMKPSMDLGSSVSNIRAIAADASVFSFGDDDEGYESD